VCKEHLQDLEQRLYERIQALFPKDDLITFMQTGILPEGENNEQRGPTKAEECFAGYILYKLGEGLWTIRKEEKE
jgi:hypothetical protein